MIVDALLFVFLVVGFYFGFTKGFIKVIGYILTVLCCLTLTIKVSPFVHQWLSSYIIGMEVGVHLVSIGLGLAAAFCVLGLVMYIIQYKISLKVLAPYNRFTGGVSLMLIFLIAYSSLVWFCDQSSVLSKQIKNNSISYQYLIKINDQSVKTKKYLQPVFLKWKDMSEESVQLKKSKNS